MKTIQQPQKQDRHGRRQLHVKTVKLKTGEVALVVVNVLMTKIKTKETVEKIKRSWEDVGVVAMAVL